MHKYLYQYFKIILIFIITLTLTSCYQKSVAHYVNNKKNYQITNLNINQFNPSVTHCYQDGFNYYISGINDNGNIAGVITNFNPILNKCLNQGFLFNTDKVSPQFIDLPYPNIKSEPNSVVITHLSNQNISTGFSTYNQDINYAIVNNETQVKLISNNYSSTSYISANSNYIIYQPYFATNNSQLYNLITESTIQLKYKNSEQFSTTLIQVDNQGNSIGYATELESDNHIMGIICHNNSKSNNCDPITADESDHNIKLSHIASNGLWIYGEEFNFTNPQHNIFLVDPITNKKIYPKELSNFIIDDDHNNITDNGVMTIVKQNQAERQFQYIYVPKQHKIYSIIALINSFSTNLDLFGTTYLYLSTNGKYIYIANNPDFLHSVLGVKIYFQQGLEEYLINNVKPYN